MPTFRLSEDERRTLLTEARQAVTMQVTGERPSPPMDPARVSRSGQGAFVTLRIDGELRGCIGHVDTSRPLLETVRRVAVAAAVEDPRFPPVKGDELGDLVFEVSVLGPSIPCPGPEGVEIGRHGVVIEQGDRRGLLLPQVAVEQGWDAEAFVAAVCAKAELPSRAWRRAARLFVFEAEVFSEDDGGPPGSPCP